MHRYRSLQRLFLCGAVFLSGFAACRADAPALPDLIGPGQWRLYQYNKAKGRLAVRPEFPAKIKDGSAAQRQSLGIKIDWQGGGDFQFFSVEPATPAGPLPLSAKELRAWVHGTSTNHSIEAHLTDADGKEVKTELGSTSVSGWRLLTARIPPAWKQPLTFRNLTFHNWSDRGASAITVYVTRLEAVGENNVSTGLPLSPAPVSTAGAPVIPISGIPHTVSDMNLPGEWRVPLKNQGGGSLSMSTAFPDGIKADPDVLRQSLQINIRFPGSEAPNGFNTFQVEPIRNIPVPYQLIETRLWLKGTGTRHNIELMFSDADGKNVNLSPTQSRLDFDGWQQVTAKVPADSLQPLTFRGIGFYSWGIKEPANLAVGVSRLEFVIDPKRPVKREESKTNDAW
ncbi:MAG: hypothetical protein V4671_12225 [Armatimonadota bacterium]